MFLVDFINTAKTKKKFVTHWWIISVLSLCKLCHLHFYCYFRTWVWTPAFLHSLLSQLTGTEDWLKTEGSLNYCQFQISGYHVPTEAPYKQVDYQGDNCNHLDHQPGVGNTHGLGIHHSGEWQDRKTIITEDKSMILLQTTLLMLKTISIFYPVSGWNTYWIHPSVSSGEHRVWIIQVVQKSALPSSVLHTLHSDQWCLYQVCYITTQQIRN